MSHPTRQAIARSAAAVLLILVGAAYPLSYAPVVRHELSQQTEMMCFQAIDGEELPIYKPIDWLIDNTPLDKPLIAWARKFGVEEEFEGGKMMRSWDR